MFTDFSLFKNLSSIYKTFPRINTISIFQYKYQERKIYISTWKWLNTFKQFLQRNFSVILLILQVFCVLCINLYFLFFKILFNSEAHFNWLTIISFMKRDSSFKCICFHKKTILTLFTDIKKNHKYLDFFLVSPNSNKTWFVLMFWDFVSPFSFWCLPTQSIFANT